MLPLLSSPPDSGRFLRPDDAADAAAAIVAAAEGVDLLRLLPLEDDLADDDAAELDPLAIAAATAADIAAAAAAADPERMVYVLLPLPDPDDRAGGTVVPSGGGPRLRA